MGHVVSASGVSEDLEKVEAVMSWERLKSVFEIRSFLGLEKYYRRFTGDFSCNAPKIPYKFYNNFIIYSGYELSQTSVFSGKLINFEMNL